MSKLEVDREAFPAPAPFSLAERDRRWGAVRQAMSTAGVDILLAFTEPMQSQIGAARPTDALYLANEPGSVIFPLDGEPILLAGMHRNPALIGTRQEPGEAWMSDVRASTDPSDRFGSTAVAIQRALAGLAVGSRRVAVSGLRGGGPYTMVRMPNGQLNHGTFVEVVKAIPQAEVVDGTSIVGGARYVKSDEEIAYLRLSEQLAEYQVQVLTDAVRPGATLAEVYAELTAAVQRHGFAVARQTLAAAPWGEPWWMSRDDGVPTVHLERHWTLKNELEPMVAGYSVQIDHPVVLGPPIAEQSELFELDQQAFAVACSAIRPGATWREVWTAVTALSTQKYCVEFLMHGRGLGDDGIMYIPVGSHEDNPSNTDEIRENTVFVLKPFARRRDDPRSDWAVARNLTWGDSVLVTPEGAQRLGKRPHELTVVE